MADIAAAGSFAPNTALPATSTLAPAAAHAARWLRQCRRPPRCPSKVHGAAPRRGWPRSFPRRGHELLPAEARLHAHHQHHFQRVQIRENGLGRRGGFDAQRGPAALVVDGLDGLFHRAFGLYVERQQVRPGGAERLYILQRAPDHQMHIVKAGTRFAKAARTGTPRLMFGTNAPSITSTCSISAPAAITAHSCGPAPQSPRPGSKEKV